jgi:molybdenum cofactor biosynthesis enzyme MoaA
MDSQMIFDWIVGIGGAIVGWMLKIIWEAIRDMRIELKNLDKQMHDDFVRRDDFKDAVREIKDDVRVGFAKVDTTLGLIFKKLEQKENRDIS